MTRKTNGSRQDPVEFDRDGLRLMLIEAQREAESLDLGFTCYLLGMAIRSIDEPEQAVPKGVVSRVEPPMTAST